MGLQFVVEGVGEQGRELREGVRGTTVMMKHPPGQLTKVELWPLTSAWKEGGREGVSEGGRVCRKEVRRRRRRMK